MNASDTDRVRPAAPPGPPASRSDAGQRFDDALRREPGGREGGDGDGDSDGEGDGRESSKRAAYTLELRGRALPPGVLQMFRASLEHGFSGVEAGDDLLEGLLHDIADGVRAGRALPGTRWRLLVRLRPELLPATEVDIACVDTQLAVVLRTANEDAYRTIVGALPRLNKSLSERRVGGSDAVVFLVAPKDLQ